MTINGETLNILLQQIIYPFLLAIGSSIDNLTIGFSISLKSRSSISVGSTNTGTAAELSHNTTSNRSTTSSQKFNISTFGSSSSIISGSIPSSSTRKRINKNETFEKDETTTSKNYNKNQHPSISNMNSISTNSSTSQIRPTISFVTFNLYISIANSLGAFVAGMGGQLLIERLIHIVLLIINHYTTSTNNTNNQNHHRHNEYHDYNDTLLNNNTIIGSTTTSSQISSFLAGMAFFYLAYKDFINVYNRDHHQTTTNRQSSSSPSSSIPLSSPSTMNTKNICNQTTATTSTSTKSNASSSCSSSSSWCLTNQDAINLAIPMTLNNIAGGIAGGASGISPYMSGFTAFIASFTMMQLGSYLASFFYNNKNKSKKTNNDHIHITSDHSPFSSSIEEGDEFRNASLCSGVVFSILSFAQLYDCFIS